MTLSYDEVAAVFRSDQTGILGRKFPVRSDGEFGLWKR